MTIHLQSLPRDLRARVISHRVFRCALLVARIGEDRDWLTLQAGHLHHEAWRCTTSAQACLWRRRCGPDPGLVTLWGRARSDALTALAAMCGRTLILRRKETMPLGLDALAELELQSYDLFASPHACETTTALDEPAPFMD